MKKTLLSISLLISALLALMFLNPYETPTNIEAPSILKEQFIKTGDDITPDILRKFKSVVEQATIFNGDDYYMNVMFIQQQLNNSYPGNYFIGFSDLGNYKESIGMVTQGQWYIIWTGVNHYRVARSYFIYKHVGNDTEVTCFDNRVNYTNSSTVFTNIVFTIFQDHLNYQDYAEQVNYWLNQHDPTVNATVFVTSLQHEFFGCVWSHPPSYNTIGLALSFPRVT